MEDRDHDETVETPVSAGTASETTLISDEERRVLELYARSKELDYEIALLRAYKDRAEGMQLDGKAQQDPSAAYGRMMKASAAYQLRKDVVDSVLTVNPILSAVHDRTDASYIERDLQPKIQERDEQSIAVAKTSSELRALLSRLTEVEAESIKVTRRNVELAADLLQLVENDSQRAVKPDPSQQKEIERLEAEVKTSRQKWKVIKGTASAVVVGSGVDWAGDTNLRAIVLDPD